MRIGITGTRVGATDRQLKLIRRILTELGPGEFHHGDCVGADVQAAALADALGYNVVAHPPTNSQYRGDYPSAQSLEPQGYFVRNRAIVDSVELLLVVPREDQWQPRGGTWYTHDYARRVGRDLIVIWPRKDLT